MSFAPGDDEPPASPVPADAVAPAVTHLVGQEQHAFNRQAVYDRHRLLITLTGSTAAFVVPATVLEGADGTAYPLPLSALLMVFVLVLNAYYRWQSQICRLAIAHLQRQRLVVLGLAPPPVDLADNERLFAVFARAAGRDVLRPDLLQMVVIFVAVVALWPLFVAGWPDAAGWLGGGLARVRDALAGLGGWVSSTSPAP